MKKTRGFHAWKGLMSSPFNYKANEDEKSLEFMAWEEGRWPNKVRQERQCQWSEDGAEVESFSQGRTPAGGARVSRSDRHHVASNTGLGAGREVRWAGVPASKPLCQRKDTTTPSRGPLRFVPS